MKNAVFWDVMLCGFCNKIVARRLLFTAKIVPSSPILVTLMMEALHFSETSTLTRAKQCNIPEGNILLC
jgi:hypothetical protein